MSIDLNQALEYAVAWAKEVGKIQLSYFRGNDLGIQTKSNVYDVVTRADKESEAFLLDKIQKHYPKDCMPGIVLLNLIQQKVKLFCWIRFRSTIPGMQSLGKKAVLMPVLPSIGG